MERLRRYLANEDNHNVAIPIISVLLGFLLGTIVLLVTGENPLVMYGSLIRAVFGLNISNIFSGGTIFSPYKIGEYIAVYVIIIVFTGLSVAFAFRTGLFNIGAEGQVVIGSLVTTVVGIYLDLPKVILLPTVLLAGTLAGAIWGFIPGLLKARFNVHEVVVTIMLNYTALHTSNYVFNQIPGTANNRTVDINEGALLTSDFLKSITNNSRLNWSIIIVIVAIVIFRFIINKTTFGFELKAVGYNPFAAKYAGMKVNRNAALSMAISGAFSGMAGAILVSGIFGYGRVLASFENYGFDGIAVALIGNNTALGSLFSALLLGALKAAQPIMQRDMPNSITIIITSSIIIFISMKLGLKKILKKLDKGGDE